MEFKKLFNLQKSFSEACFSSEGLSESEKIEKHKTFCLALHDEATQLANAVHFKDHRQVTSSTDRQKILYESIDVIRYALATLNLWNFSDSEVLDAFLSRDLHLWDKKKKPITSWKDQPVVIVDVDDVIAKFREGFFGWLNENFGLTLTPEHPEYYYSGPAGNITGEEAFAQFIEQGGFLELPVSKNLKNALSQMRSNGIWVQLLTARPSDNLKCLYDTYMWLDHAGIEYDNISFSFEKYRWLSDKPFYNKGKVICAIDDSPKHASEYASQGISVLVPKRTYNKEVWNNNNIVTFDWEEDNVNEIIQSVFPGSFPNS